MKKQLPKTCLTCKYMEFVDDECEVLHCFNGSIVGMVRNGTPVNDDYTCSFWELDKAVQDDADMGMWG